MNRIKELFENLITFFRRIIHPKAVAEEVPDTELPEETVEPTYSRSGKHRSKPLSQHPFRRFGADPFDQDSPDHWARL